MNAALREYLPVPSETEIASIPPWRTLGELNAADLPTPPAVVDGLIRRGEIAVLGGASKSFKSWAALDLALSVATGAPWLERQTTPGRVLVVNLELPEWCLRCRLHAIQRARNLRAADDALLCWTLRWETVTARKLHDTITARKPEGLALVVLDPVYRLLAGRDENAAGDIAEMLAEVAPIAGDTGAAVLLPAHFAKGTAATKEAMDRVSGSGVFARFPDSLLTLTRHEEDGAFALESVLRTFPPAEPCVVRWQHPHFVLDRDGLDPSKLRLAPGRAPKYSDDDILAALGSERLSYTDWLTAAEQRTGISRRTFAERLQRMIRQRRVIKCATGDAYYRPAGADGAETPLTNAQLSPSAGCGDPSIPPHLPLGGLSAESAESAESITAPTFATANSEKSTRKRRGTKSVTP